MLNNDLKNTNKLLIAAYLKLHLNDQNLLQLSNAMFSQLNISEENSNSIEGSNFDLTTINSFIQMDQKLPIIIDTTLFVNGYGMYKQLITLYILILQ